ncbi:MAG: amino acid permease [Acidobacteriaceae bacterium]
MLDVLVPRPTTPSQNLGVSENQRDAGLVRAVGLFGLAASIITLTIGAGIFEVPGALAACIGIYAPLAFLVCGVAIGAVAICFAEGGSRMPTSGGAYGYVADAFGPLTGYVVGTLLWISDLLAAGGVAAALADATASVVPIHLQPFARSAVILCVIGGIAFVHIGGVERGARLINIATLLKLLPLAIFVIAGASAIHRVNFVQPASHGTHDVGRALILAFFVLTGMEISLSASGEVANPARTIPRALIMAIVPVTLLYIVIQVTAQGILGTALAHSSMPLVDAMARINPALRLVMLSGAAIAMFGFLSGDIFCTPRILFAFARDGLLPRVLGRLHPRSHTPYIAILCYAALAITLALAGNFEELAVLSTLATAALYMAACAAAWRLARKGVAEAGTPLNFRWLGVAMVVGVGSMLALIALASRTEIIGLFVVIGASAAIYLIQTRYAPSHRRA